MGKDGEMEGVRRGREGWGDGGCEEGEGRMEGRKDGEMEGRGRGREGWGEEGGREGIVDFQGDREGESSVLPG